jgi:high-affinity iron transporter
VWITRCDWVDNGSIAMIVSRRVSVLFRESVWLFVVILLGVGPAFTQPAPSSSASPTGRTEAQQLVFLLQYVGSDYGGAVENGRIVDDAEYRENREFTALIVERFRQLRSTMPPAKLPSLEKAIQKLDKLVSARADARLVKEVTEAAIPLAIEVFSLPSFPRERPDPELASHLYTESCTPCHGAHGAGDGPRAKELDPRPARFTDPARMNTVAPYLFYNAITLGIPNTAMASFSDSLSDQERWDLAFYLWTFALRRGEDEPGTVLSLSLRDLATRSSADLVPEVVRQTAARGQSIDETGALAWLARLRAHPPLLSHPQEQLARLRQALDRSVGLVEGGDVEAAANLVTNAYLAEFEPLEPELDRRDARVRQGFEQGLIELRAALRRGDRPVALARLRTLGEAVVQAERLLNQNRTGMDPNTSRLLMLLLVVTLAGVLLVWWIGKETAVS